MGGGVAASTSASATRFNIARRPRHLLDLSVRQNEVAHDKRRRCGL